MPINIPILDGEDWLASQAIDDTDSVIRSMLDLTNHCIELKIKLKDSTKLHTDLSLHNAAHNIELETDKWFTFCASLKDTEISEMSNEVSIKLKTYIEKHFK